MDLIKALSSSPELLVIAVAIAGLVSILKLPPGGNVQLRKTAMQGIMLGGMGVPGIVLILREAVKFFQ